MDPVVSFIVPCYKLAHLLPECVDSILEQTYRNFEILIMDDCSPDNTAEVAQSYKDARVIHVRNNPNLGHLRNYNKGIELARGKYIWLISADDRLRRPYALERYVALMENHSDVGYVFCPGMDLDNGQEKGVLGYSVHGEQDTIFESQQFVTNLIRYNAIVAPSVMARKECYVKDPFPLDMPWGGDWYLWLVFSLSWKVGYFAEPMVCYRRHQLSMTHSLMNQDLGACYSDDIKIPWIIKQKAEAMGDRSLVKACLTAISQEYAQRMAAQRYRTSNSVMTLDEFEKSLNHYTSLASEKTWVRARTYVAMADRYCWQEQYALGRQFYWLGIRKNVWNVRAWIRFLVLSTGSLGIWLRKAFLSVRQLMSQAKHSTSS